MEQLFPTTGEPFPPREDLEEILRGERDALKLRLAWAAHELQGPLTATRASLEYLSTQDGLGRAERRLINGALDELKHCSTLCKSVLNWAPGEEKMHLRRTNLSRLVAQTVRSCALEAGAEKGRLIVVAPPRVEVDADGKHLKSALANVIRNALLHSPLDRQVEVHVTADERGSTIEVADEGPGIPPSENQRIFAPFVRTRAAGRVQGTGLGLFIAERVIDVHGGTIWVEPNHRGGSSFYIRLPLAEPRRGARAERDQKPQARLQGADASKPASLVGGLGQR